jgi:energy-coupling factor transporter ATP-binding protein EcfA2
LIGYVPQDDIIHRELTCRQALTYAGKLRLPPDTTDEELQKLVEETLNALDMSVRGDVPISKLSGGQRKRVSVGVELLNRPGILFLDEPTSGLDPSTESRLMRKFKQLASQGRTVVCTTHVMENIDLFDKVAVLAPGGKLAFFGPPAEAKPYFGIEKYTLLYDRLEEKTPDSWKHDYVKSPLHAELLAPALKSDSNKKRRRHRIAPASPFSAPSQWLILTCRYMRILSSDRQNLVLFAAQPLLIAWLICQVCTDLPQILFLLVVSGIWFGCSNAAQQIVKERTIYRRERMVNLRLDCYILSKFLPLAAICAIQCGLMLWVISLFHDLRGNPLVLFASPLLASLNGVAMGLIISAFAANPDKAMFVVPISLLPQIILGGLLAALPSMSTAMQFASCLAASRWANQAIEVTLLDGRTIDHDLLGDDAYIRPLWNLYPADDLRNEEGRRQFLQDHAGSEVRKSPRSIAAFSVLFAFLVLQLALVAFILRRQDAF